MRDRWRGLTSSSPAAIIHALHWASGASPFSARALPFLSLRENKTRAHFFVLFGGKKNQIHTLVTSLHPPHLCRLAVFSIKPTFSLTLINPRRAPTCLSHLS